jgi:ATP-dependent Clp protease protease subunit
MSETNFQYIPIIIEKSPHGERVFDIFSKLLEERIVFVGGPIHDAMANAVIAQLLYLQSDSDKKDISIYINSPGGSAYAGMALYDTIRHMKPDVSTIAVGTAASAATLLLAAGTKGKRYSLPHSVLHIHQPMGQLGGQASDIEIDAKEILRLKKLYAQTLSDHTGQTMKKVMKDIDRDFYMTAAEGKKYGIIDEVINTEEGVKK